MASSSVPAATSAAISRLKAKTFPQGIMPRVIAHRGARSISPENTLPAIITAKKLGATFCEVDIMLSKDKVAFIHHDKYLERCSNGQGLFASKTASELDQLDAGSWFSPDFAGAHIPRLTDLLQTCKDLDIGVNLEIKHLRVKADDTPTDEEYASEREAALETCRILTEWDANPSKIVISSFSVGALEICQEKLPNVRRSLLVEAIPDDWADQVERLGCVSFNFNAKKCRREQVEQIYDAGVPMYCYTVNDPERAIELLGWGVSGVFSDCYDVVEKAIQHSGMKLPLRS